MKTVLFVHQSADLYGSDKVLLDLARGIQSHGFKPLALLPVEGPLLDRLRAAGVETHVLPLARLNRASFSPMGLLRLPGEIIKAVRAMDAILRGRKIDLVHSNTLAVLGGAFWARWHRVPHVWHVHELLVSPAIVRTGFPWLLKLMADRVICNSRMTERWLLDERSGLAPRTEVIWNGIEPLQGNNPGDEKIVVFRKDVRCDEQGTLCVAMVGRINRMKGQSLLVDAASILWNEGVRHVVFVMVGSPPHGQGHFLDQLLSRVATSPARERIAVRDFQADIWPVWCGCDIAVVPSAEPESFGLVAIEAMAAGKPLVAAAHGGLLDIVDDGKSGILVPPNDAMALAAALKRLIGDRALREEYGQAGRLRQRELFSLESQLVATVKCYQHMLSQTKERKDG